MYKFSRDVNFAVFAVNLSSTKFKSSKFHKTIVIHLKHQGRIQDFEKGGARTAHVDNL